jgi:hypothetical protein
MGEIKQPNRAATETPDVFRVGPTLVGLNQPIPLLSRHHALGWRRGVGTAGLLAINEVKRALPTISQLTIDFRQDFCVEQRTVPDAAQSVDPVPIAKSVQTVRLTGMSSSGERQSVGDTIHSDRATPEPRQLGVDEAHVKLSVVDDELRIAQKSKKGVDDFREDRLVFYDRGGMTVHPRRVLRYVTLRIDKRMKHSPCQRPVDDFHRTDF